MNDRRDEAHPSSPGAPLALPAVQCVSCIHWQVRGGNVLAAAHECVALEDEKLPARAAAMIVGMARLLAGQGLCPVHQMHDQSPDSYLSEDLPIECPDDRSVNHSVNLSPLLLDLKK